MLCRRGSEAFWAARIACVLALATLAAAQWNDEEAQQDCANKNECSASFPVTPSCRCSDLAPVIYAGGRVNATCLEVLEQNNCGQPWIQNVSTSEITDGYCVVSCGRCDCCQTFSEALTNHSFSTFLQAANAAGLTANLSSPAYSFSVLAPTDAAFAAFLARNRLTLPQLIAAPATLRRVVAYHILPNVPVLDAFWTSPFLLPGTVLATQLGSTATITVGPGPTFNSAAHAVSGDIPVCKGNIIGIDAVLTPPPAAVARSPLFWNPTPAASAAANITGALATPPAVLARAAAAPQIYLPGEPRSAAPAPVSLAPELQNSAATGP